MYSDSASLSGGVLEAERFDYPKTDATETAANTDAGREPKTADQPARQRDAAAFEQGIQQGQARAQGLFQAEIQQLRQSLETALERFKKDRESYFGLIENEVVHLALAIAKKILHREAQMDPLLLAGMVHVALEKLESGTRIRLHANPQEIHFWRDHFAQSERPHLAPELIGDPALGRGQCYLDTEVGSTHVSLESQLKEIEQGFFDLLQHRPQVR